MTTSNLPSRSRRRADLGGSQLRRIALIMVSCLLPQMAAAQPPSDKTESPPPPPATLPSGANALQETFQDWQVACAPQGGVSRCALSQQQSDPQSKQRVLLLTLSASATDRAEGILVLPFGLALDPGVTLQVDDGALLPTLRFRTCLPAGCIVPLSFDGKAVTALRKGTTLKLKVTAAETSKEMTLPISLKGFPGAFDRTLALSR
ncbi:invasion associated locus B family protein [Bradyrhizobium sp. HKCCYLS2038]|uniref:invasion associated locus B family protein n=1 Tax=unclassified Bradyrhizobium TaxID=2631580 RepID=UPI003EBB60C7